MNVEIAVTTIISIIVVICQNSRSIGQHFLRYCTNYRHVGLKINQRWINLGSNMVILAEASMIMISGGGLRWNLFFTIDCLHKVFKSRADLFRKRQETDEYRGKYPQLSGQEKLPNTLPLTFICYGDFPFWCNFELLIRNSLSLFGVWLLPFPSQVSNSKMVTERFQSEQYSLIVNRTWTNKSV